MKFSILTSLLVGVLILNQLESSAEGFSFKNNKILSSTKNNNDRTNDRNFISESFSDLFQRFSIKNPSITPPKDSRCSVCGIGAKCEIIDNAAVCSCPVGVAGDPFEKCCSKIFFNTLSSSYNYL